MSEIAIQFDRVGKLYQLGLVGTGTLSHDLNRWWKTVVLHKEDPYLKIGETNDRSKKGKSEFVWALHDITFDVNQGDVVGIIGKNGAGKSTLLKLLSRVTSPTVGAIRAKGRIASLLEVGTGFHPELTGRENIYMNGSIMGMTRHEIKRKLDEIVDFAGVERYVDTPVKRYSSGMTVRLGFAVAAFLEPEILVVDEVLAVGDAEFQKKAIGKMQDVSHGEGRTVLFVSHNMAAVEGLCTRGIVLENGMVAYSSNDIKLAIDFYLGSHNLNSYQKTIKENISFCSSFININSIMVNGTETCYSVIRSHQSFLEIEISGLSKQQFKTDLLVLIKTENNVPIAYFSLGHAEGILTKVDEGNFCIRRKIELPHLNKGIVLVDICLHHPMVEWQMKAISCVILECEGYQNSVGHASDIKDCGWISLNSYSK